MSRIRICVVIGLQQNLDDVLQEAKEVAAAAKESGLFDKVYELIGQEATAENIRSKLSDAAQCLRDNSFLLVYYCGHGYSESGFTWIKSGEELLALEMEVFLSIIERRKSEQPLPSCRRLDIGFVFSCCMVDPPEGLQRKQYDASLPGCALADDTIVKLYASEPGGSMPDCALLGYAFSFHLRKRPSHFVSLLQRVCTDVRHLSIDRIQPRIVGGSNLGNIEILNVWFGCKGFFVFLLPCSSWSMFHHVFCFRLPGSVLCLLFCFVCFLLFCFVFRFVCLILCFLASLFILVNVSSSLFGFRFPGSFLFLLFCFDFLLRCFVFDCLFVCFGFVVLFCFMFVYLFVCLVWFGLAWLAVCLFGLFVLRCAASLRHSAGSSSRLKSSHGGWD